MAIAALIIAVVAAVIAAASAISARHSVDEARRSRLDDLGPHLTISQPAPQRERWMTNHLNGPLTPPPGLAKPGTEFVMPGNAGTHLLLGAHIVIKNEGQSTARISIGGKRVDRCDKIDNIELVVAPPSENAPLRIEGPVSIGPGESVGALIRTGPTIEEWVQKGDYDQVIQIESQASGDGAIQRWQLRLRADLLNAQPFDSSHFRVLPHTLVEASIQELPREYPKRQSPWKRKA